ncbi:MAG TPA: Wzz/FepE/Etk N-terminal domain-containing protein [Bryobacteraceae bacterium]|jgi:polysaccharide chain length determinant protein (PEP-CTERM system associated)|nr:Wzz/FepE/Etk N-terminal domain-containing protein [Bryobacteraceae bacterium]
MNETAELEAPPQNSHQALTIIRMLWNRRWLIACLWLFFSVIAVVVARLLPAVYKAEAVVLVDSQKIPEAYVSPTVQGDAADRLALISQSVMTSSRLLAVIDHFGLYRGQRSSMTQDELLRKMRQDISVSFEKNWTGDRMKAFRLGYQGRNPKIVADVANRLASLYVEENTIARESQAEGTVQFLTRQLQEAKRSLDEQEQKVARFKQEHNGSLPEQENSLLGTLSSTSVELQGVEASIARAQENKLSLEAALAAAESSESAVRASLAREAKGLSGTTSSVPRSVTLGEQLRALRLRYTPDYPEVKAVEEQLAEARREEAEQPAAPALAETSRPIRTSPELLQLRERIASLKAQIEVSKHQISSYEKQRDQLSAQLAETRERVGRLPLVEQEMADLKRNYDESAANYNSLLQKQLAAGMATDMERSQKSERFTIIDPARPPQAPEKPKRLVIALIGSIAGLFLGAAAGLGLEYRKGVLLGEWELPAGTLVLGRVPPIEQVGAEA